MLATPTCSQRIAVTKPDRFAGRCAVCRACGSRLGSSTTRTSPPCSSMTSRNVSRARPVAIISAANSRPSFTVFVRPPSTNIHADNSKDSSTKSAGPPPCSTSMHSSTSNEFPIFRPSGCSISVISATIFLPMRVPVSTISSAKYSASACFFMNAPSPVFTSSTSASIPSAIFLLMIDAVIR